MGTERTNLLNLLFDNKCPNDWEFNKNLHDYISKLGTYTTESLTKEPQKLSEEHAVILEHTQELAVSNYKTFIETAECSRKSFDRFNDIDTKLESLLQLIPTFEEKCQAFVEKTNNTSNLRKLNSITLTKNAQLLEILELPQLMESFIKDNLYEDALELATYVHRLNEKHSDIPIFKSIVDDVDKLWHLMVHQLLLQLRSDIQLPKCLQIVGHLRRMGVFTEPELRLKFLQARNFWFTKSLESIHRADANHHLSKTIEVTRVNLFNIITQYRAVFNDDEHNPLLTSRSQNVNQNCIFFCWLKQKISEFLITLDMDLNEGVTSIDSVLGQCMYFGLSFSKVGCDFRQTIMPVFLKAILANFRKSINTATRDFECNMEKFTLINKNHPKVPWKSKSSESMQPPDSLLEFFPLADYMNKVLTTFNSLRLCAPMAIVNEIVTAVEESLMVVSKGLFVLYGQEHQAFTPNAKDAFTRLCMSFADDLVPYLQKAIHIIYKPNNIAQYLGVSMQALQNDGVTILNRKRIIENIEYLLPAKINPVLDITPKSVELQDVNDTTDAEETKEHDEIEYVGAILDVTE